MKPRPFKYLRKKAYLFFEAKEKKDNQSDENLIFDEVFLDDTKYVGKILADGNTAILIGGTSEDEEATGSWEASQVLVIPADDAEDKKVAVMQHGEKGNSETAFEDSKDRELSDVLKKVSKWSEFNVLEVKDGEVKKVTGDRIVVSKDDDGEVRFDVASFGGSKGKKKSDDDGDDGEKDSDKKEDKKDDKKEDKKSEKKEDKKDDDKKDDVKGESLEDGTPEQFRVEIPHPDTVNCDACSGYAPFYTALDDLSQQHPDGSINPQDLQDAATYGDIADDLDINVLNHVTSAGIAPELSEDLGYLAFELVFDDASSAGKFKTWLNLANDGTQVNEYETWVDSHGRRHNDEGEDEDANISYRGPRRGYSRWSSRSPSYRRGSGDDYFERHRVDVLTPDSPDDTVEPSKGNPDKVGVKYGSGRSDWNGPKDLGK